MIHLDLFSGAGGFSLGLKEAGIPITKTYFSEIDKHAIANYKYNFNEAEYIGSVTDVRGRDLGEIDIITFGSPCFVAGTKILTNKGYKSIENCKSGDKVLTHKNRWKEVINLNVNNQNKTIHKIKIGKQSEAIECSPNHPFYVVQRTYTKKKHPKPVWSEPMWLPAKDLDDSCFIITSKVEETTPFDITAKEAYLLGYYMAEGWVDKTKRKRDGKQMFRICFAMHEDEVTHFKELISKITYKGRFLNKKNINVTVDENYSGKSVKCTISNERLYRLCEKVGSGAITKKVPGFILSAELELQKAFLDGYMFGDGCYIKKIKKYQASSVSREMAYGICQLVLNVHNELPSMTLHAPSKTKMLEGRVVNQRPYYQIRWFLEKSRERFSHEVQSKIVIKVISNETRKSREPVYNIGVREDESYTVGNIIVHNCQDFSIAGKRKGMGGDRSSLIAEAIRLIDECRPRFFIWENVKGTFSSNNSEDFWAIIQAFTNIRSYRLEWQLCNTKWLLPQNRERIYLVGLTGATSGREVFPLPENDRRINERAEQAQNVGCLTAGGNSGGMHSSMTLIRHRSDQPFKTGNIAPALRNGDKGEVRIVERQLDAQEIEIIEHRGHKNKPPKRIKNGIVPTLKAESHGHETKIVIKSNTKKGFELAREGDSINYSVPTSKTRRGSVGKGVAQTLDTACSQGVIAAMRGRNPNNPSDRRTGSPTEQRLEINTNGTSNTLTSVQKDNLVILGYSRDKDGKVVNRNEKDSANTLHASTDSGGNTDQFVKDDYRIRRLTPTECERLQGFPDSWTAFGNYDGETKVISDTQRYKLMGNAVTVAVVKAVGEQIKKAL